MAGCTVVEFELMATAAPPAGGGAQAVEHVDRAEIVDRGQEGAGPARHPGQPGERDDPVERARAPFRGCRHGDLPALGRDEVGDDVGVVLIDADDAPAGSGQPAAVAAPIPEAAPVMTTVRSGSGARLQQGQRLVGVRPMDTSEWMTSSTVRSVSMTKVIRLS